MKVRFHNGTTVVDGFIVQQLNWIFYLVSSDAINFYKVRLAQTDDQAQSLTEGFATVVVNLPDGTLSYAKKLTNNLAYLTKGGAITWTTGAAVNISVPDASPVPVDTSSSSSTSSTSSTPTTTTTPVDNTQDASFSLLRLSVFGF